MEHGEQLPEHQERRPTPDPTTLTRAMVGDATTMMREQLNRELASAKELLDTRFAGMQQILNLMQSQIDKIPPDLTIKIQALKETINEKFQGVTSSFVERDTRFGQESKDYRLMVDGMMQTAKDMIRQLDTQTDKRLEQMAATIADLRLAVAERTEASAQRAEKEVAALRTEFLTKLTEGRLPIHKELGPGQIIAVIFGVVVLLGLISAALLRL